MKVIKPLNSWVVFCVQGWTGWRLVHLFWMSTLCQVLFQDLEDSVKNIDKLSISFPYIFPFLKKLVFWGHDRQLVNTGKVRSDHGVLKQSPKTVLYSRDSMIERCKHCVLMMLTFSALSLWRLPCRGRDWGLGDSTMANMCWVFAMCQASLLAFYLYCFYYYIDSSRVGVVISIL